MSQFSSRSIKGMVLGHLSPEGRGRRAAPGEGFSLSTRAQGPLTRHRTNDVNSREQSHG